MAHFVRKKDGNRTQYKGYVSYTSDYFTVKSLTGLFVMNGEIILAMVLGHLGRKGTARVGLQQNSSRPS